MKAAAMLSLTVGEIVLSVAHAAQDSASPRFAAPEAASTLPAGSVSGVGQVTFALLLVLVAVFVVAVLVKKLRTVTGAGTDAIEVLAQTSLGAKERAVIVRVGNTRLLLGVASGQVSLLQTLGLDTAAESPIASSNQAMGFAALLKKSLGR